MAPQDFYKPLFIIACSFMTLPVYSSDSTVVQFITRGLCKQQPPGKMSLSEICDEAYIHRRSLTTTVLSSELAAHDLKAGHKTKL